MTIVEYFNPTNYQHLRAYDYLQHKGRWSKDFNIFDLEFPVGWQIALLAKIANAFLDEKLGR
jgi:hypothetical protein